MPCALHGGAEDGDDLEKTAAYDATIIAGAEVDGFPKVDDLISSQLSQYAIGPLIGRGTMGRVYRAEHNGLKRPCAIKILNPGLIQREPGIVEQFWGEARAVAALVHPHVVTVHNLGQDRGYHFIEMELVEHRPPYWREMPDGQGQFIREFVPGGVSLTEKIVKEGPLAPEPAALMARQVAMALTAAHRAGLVHRDVKPANVLLTADGQAKLADFGLVRRLAELRRGSNLAGTPTYMAPELFEGADPSACTDLYSVGVTLYYLLTARLPFIADKITHLVQLKLRQDPPPLQELAPAVPDVLADLVHRLLHRDPANRYDSAESLSLDLRSLLGRLRDTSTLVEESTRELGAYVQQTERDRFRIVVPVPGQRIHEVYIEAVPGSGHEALLSVYAVCAPADADHFEFALKLNSRLTHGSVSIRDFYGKSMFVMSRTFNRGSLTNEELRSAILEIAIHSDHVEELLTQTDVY